MNAGPSGSRSASLASRSSLNAEESRTCSQHAEPRASFSPTPQATHQSTTGSARSGRGISSSTTEKPALQGVSHTQGGPLNIKRVSIVRPGSDKMNVCTESETHEKEAQLKALNDRRRTTPTAAASGTTSTSTTGLLRTAGRMTADSPASANAFEQQIEGKRWYEVLPAVLQKFKSHDREQIKQLMLPRCTLCECGKVNQKAVIECQQKGCFLLDRPLCLVCWKSTHLSCDKAQNKHCSRSTSMCPQCQLGRIEYWCAECDLKFCGNCFEQIHNVDATKDHRKIATEDAPGTCLSSSHWSAYFYEAICHSVTSRKQMTNGNTGDSSIGGKRKREIEVIVIDNDDDAEEDEPVIISPPGNQSAQQQADTCGSAAIRPKTSSTGTCALSQQNASANTDDQAASAHATMLEPFPFFEAPIHTSSSPYALPVHPSYSTPSISKGVNTVTPHANVGLQWGNSNFPFGMPPLVGNGHGSPVYTTNIMSPGATLSSAPASVGTPMWPTTSGISTDLASTLSLNNLHARRGAVSAQNVLVDSLVDRYHEVNQNVASMELQGEQLTRQIALAARQGPYTARPIMDLLNKLQPALEASKGLRDKLLIAMIVQSDDIMASVRSLRLSELGDVPQVPSISHRKCLQLSIEINRHKKKLVESNQQISDMLAKSYTVTSSMENSLIQSASAEIQVHERNIMRLKKARNVEFVRIVQFSNNIREALKQTFQQTVEAQRHQQQLQQFQPF